MLPMAEPGESRRDFVSAHADEPFPMIGPSTLQHRSEFTYAFWWLLVCALLGYGTYLAVESTPKIAPQDKAKPPFDTTPKEIEASNVLIKSMEPGTSTVRWELAVPETSAGISSASRFENPEIVLYPEGEGFTITAKNGTLAQAPAGEEHKADNSKLTLEGPIVGTSIDKSQSFKAAHAEFDGALNQLTLTGSPIELRRGGLIVRTPKLVVTFRANGNHRYEMSSGVDVEGTGAP